MSNNINNNLICCEPFESIEITSLGNVVFCCACHIKNIFIGNIYKNSFEEIWNSKTAIEYREKILNNDYSLCDKDICIGMKNKTITFKPKKDYMQPIMTLGPISINLGYDFSCNSRCFYCRDEIITNSFSKNLELNALSNKIFIPLTKNAKRIVIGSNGECLASWHSRNLIKQIIKQNSKVKFEILTNGILATQKTFKELNIEDKICAINITINATTKETYKNVCRNNCFDKIIKNLSYIGRLKAEGRLDFHMSFVVSNLNYFEMPDFQRLANKYGAVAHYWEYRKQGVKCHKDYDEHAINLANHPNHIKLIETPNDPIFDNPKSNYLLNPVLEQIKNTYILNPVN